MGEIHCIHYSLCQYKLLFQSSSNQSEELKTDGTGAVWAPAKFLWVVNLTLDYKNTLTLF